VRALGPLMELLGDEDARVRAHAAFGLGRAHDALEIGFARHDALRAELVARLHAELDDEDDDEVRAALVRAIARTATDDEGLAPVLAARSAPARRGPAAGPRGVHTPPAAAPPGPLVDDEARLFVLRAPQEDGRAATAALAAVDWRIRTEGARALGRLQHALPFDAIARALDVAIANASRSPNAGGDAHVVAALCDTMVNAPRERTVALLDKAIAGLARTRDDVACACAVAKDAQHGVVDAVAHACAPLGDEAVRRARVRATARAFLPSKDKADRLDAFLRDEAVKVRLEAANALAADANPASWAVAARALTN
jgi:hypothetical protein